MDPFFLGKRLIGTIGCARVRPQGNWGVAGEFVSKGVARVLVPLALPTVLDYRWPLMEAPLPGQWVRVPVGRKSVDGVVVEALAESPFGSLKDCEVLEGVPPLAPQTLDFYRWAPRYTLSAPGEALRVGLMRGKIPPQVKVSRNKDKGDDGRWVYKPVGLTDGQAAAAKAVGEGLDGFGVFLLDGVTGSGKTEVYFDVIAKVLAEGKQALVLVPEIALVPQWLARFKARFGRAPWLWHSGLAEGAKRKTWWAMANGEPGVVVGARSALFLPFQKLGLLVVDEEHDPSYKQDEAFRYNGRDMAVQAGRTWQAPVVLASATPSLESWHNAKVGKYTRLVLPDRFGGAMAPVGLIDLKREKMQRGMFVSPTLREAVGGALAKGEQVLLFLNRRGNAPLLLCHDCGVRRDCPRCSASLVVHGNTLRCHHCGYTEKFPEECPSCGSAELMTYGPGTRQVVSEVQGLFPDARVAVADSDALTTPKQLGEVVEALENHTVDIVVGTQMVTKGHHFPNLTLVGVIDGDMGLAQGELRAAERTFQLMTQVAGRAGRGEKAGKVLVQTHMPEQPLFQCLVKHDRDGFYDLELAAREQWGQPPFGRQVAVIVDGLDAKLVEAAARALAVGFPKDGGMRVMGPAPAPLAKRKDKWRWRLLLSGPKVAHGAVLGWVESTALPKGVRVEVDVDPVSFM
jgi:primosomal protein N' (replication factor Y)